MKTTIHEVAKSLDLPPNTIERWIRQGRIPVRKTDSGCVFQKSVLETWAKKHNLRFSLDGRGGGENLEGNDKQPDDLFSAMTRGGAFYDIAGENVEAVLKNAVENITLLTDELRNDLHQRLLEREALTSTGLGKGIAIPHPRVPMEETMEEPVIVTCFLKEPVDYGAIDDKPVFVLFILLSPTVKVHLHLLSRLAFCLRDNDFVEFLKSAPPESALFSMIENFDKKLDG